ncbi:hypothetical protein CPB83DRAFT_840590 [Crepidotus variabilis]|uniref:Uncharacterized protein n=1 Tax=Crepidotus variabilis TaxID=179855 RepID=A0A9P6E495_9AGAR|nr:hypothetical protein CPB83DRAFT_840590 [Crepidotus variabilis]
MSLQKILETTTTSIYPSPPPSPLPSPLPWTFNTFGADNTFASDKEDHGSIASSLGSPPPLIPITPSPSPLPSYPPYFEDTPYSPFPLPHPSQFNLPPLRSLGLDPNPTSSHITHNEHYDQHIRKVVEDPAFIPRLTFQLHGPTQPAVRHGLTLREFRNEYLDPESLYWLSHECQSNPAIIHSLPMAVRTTQSAKRLTRIANCGRQILGAIRFQINKFEKEVGKLEDIRDDHYRDGHLLFDYMQDCGMDLLARDFVADKRRRNTEAGHSIQNRSPTPGPTRRKNRSNHKKKSVRFSERLCTICHQGNHTRVACPLEE